MLHHQLMVLQPAEIAEAEAEASEEAVEAVIEAAEAEAAVVVAQVADSAERARVMTGCHSPSSEDSSR